MGIPLLIWQTWKTHRVPEKWADSPKSIHKWAPEFHYRLFDDEENRLFVEEQFPEWLPLYLSFDREIYRVDMVRYLRLYRYGGVYMDLDLKLKLPLSDLFTSDADLYLVRTPNGGGYTNSFMASKPGCLFWLYCIEEIHHRVKHKPWYVQGDWKVIWTTGPSMITKVVSEYDRPFVTVPYKLGHPCSVCDHYRGACISESSAYVEELEGSSWTSPSVKLVHAVYCEWQTVLLMLAVLALAVIALIAIHSSNSV